MKSQPVQKLIPIKEIRDDVLVLNDGSLVMILMASSINFSLKSQEEQTAITLQYQAFLNTLDFPIQFFVESSALNIEPYLAMLQKYESEQTNDLLKIQTREYGEFVKNFVETSHIMSKTFYISLSYKTSQIQTQNGIAGIFKGLTSKKTKQEIPEEKFTEYKNQLWQRIDVVTSGLSRTGVHAAPLKTEELIELFYNLYNPGEAAKGLMPATDQNT